jgi:hypothetical protein
MRRNSEGVRDALPQRFAHAIGVTCLVAWSCTPFKNDQHHVSDTRTEPDAATREGDCAEDSDCPPSSPCSAVHCDEGKCIIKSTRNGVPVPSEQQVEGDCKKLVCDGRGQIRSENDDADTRGGGNPCLEIRCLEGTREIVDAPDDTLCNGDGRCRAGTCSACSRGSDCSRASDCTEHRDTCRDGKSSCEDTGVPRAGRACGEGKVCHDGSCVPCSVGAECDTGTPCYLGRITSCTDALVCQPQPQSGIACGEDATGRMRYCVAGLCVTPCRDGPCMTSNDPCQTSHWDCSTPGGVPVCAPVALADGESCGERAVCYDGTCAARSLVNGDFSRGLDGWDVSGDRAAFLFMVDEASDNRRSFSTSPTAAATGGEKRISVSQSFIVADDAVAVRFNIFGGGAHVRLKDASGSVLEDCTGLDSNDVRTPVSWDLSERRGQRLTLAIEDDLDTGEWAYVSGSGFDVIRDVPGPIRNAQWADGFEGWESTGDGLYFALFDDYNYSTMESGRGGVPAYGRRLTVSTYGRDRAASSLGTATLGTISQVFVVPSDAVALRFNVHGGRAGQVRLLDGSKELHMASARDSDAWKVPVSWDLQPFRGKTLRLSIEDPSTSTRYGYIGTTGFDVITSYNGP